MIFGIALNHHEALSDAEVRQNMIELSKLSLFHDFFLTFSEEKNHNLLMISLNMAPIRG